MTPAALAKVHAAAFAQTRAWSAEEITLLLDSPFVFCVHDAAAFALGRTVADESELLTIAVDPVFQKQGFGQRVLTQFEAESLLRGARHCFLEVSEDNFAATNLYLRAGYEICGTRANYYTRKDGTQMAASLMKKTLR